MEQRKSELTVITRAKDLCAYVMTVTHKRKLRSMQKAYAEEDLELSKIQQVLSSYKGHLSHGHTWHLQKKVLGDFILQRTM